MIFFSLAGLSVLNFSPDFDAEHVECGCEVMWSPGGHFVSHFHLLCVSVSMYVREGGEE